MEVPSSMRRWPVIALVVGAVACADQPETDVDADIDAVPPAAETTPAPTTAMMSEAEVVQAVTVVNQAEIDEAELARTNSQNEQVRQFAEMMITDHTRLLEEARQLSGQDGTDATRPPPAGTGAQPPAGAAAPGAAPQQGVGGAGVIQQLERESQTARLQLEALSGAEFDQAYIERQVQAHQSALDLIEMQLLPSVQDPQLRQTLESARPVIQQHLQRAQEIQQQLDTGTTDTTATGDRTA